MSAALNADKTVDASGLLCPEPIMLLHKAVRQSAHADLILLISTDPASLRDVAAFCENLSHDLVSSEHVGAMQNAEEAWHFYVRANKA